MSCCRCGESSMRGAVSPATGIGWPSTVYPLLGGETLSRSSARAWPGASIPSLSVQSPSIERAYATSYRPPPSSLAFPPPFISGMAPIAGMTLPKSSRAPSTGAPPASRRSRCRTFSPASGGSGSRRSTIEKSPACSAVERSFFLAQAASKSSAQAATARAVLFTALVPLVMSALRRLVETQVRAGRGLQLGQALLVHREVTGQLEIVHAQLARAVQHHGELAAARGVAGLGRLHGVAGDGDELVVQVDLPLLRDDVRMRLGHLRRDPVAQAVLRFASGDDVRIGGGDHRSGLAAAKDGQADLYTGEEEVGHARRVLEGVHLGHEDAQVRDLRGPRQASLRLRPFDLGAGPGQLRPLAQRAGLQRGYIWQGRNQAGRGGRPCRQRLLAVDQGAEAGPGRLAAVDGDLAIRAQLHQRRLRAQHLQLLTPGRGHPRL